MSKVIKWQYPDFFQPRREKLVNMLLSEIIFLKSQSKKCDNNERKWIEVALDKLEYILIALKKNDKNLSEDDFNRTVMIVYDIFREITNNL